MAVATSHAFVHCEVVQSIDSSGTLNIFVVCLDRVGSEHNIIDKEFGLAFARAIYDAKSKIEDGEIDVVVVCSAKKGSFMAGADIFTEMKYVGVQGSQRSFHESGQLQTLFYALEALPIPTVAILNGTTLGGGLELALACDYRIADSDYCKQIGLPEVQIGVLPGGGGCVRLPYLIGFRQSLNLLLTGKSVTARKALRMGIVDDVVSETATVLTSGDEKVGEDEESTRSYKYNWLLKFLDYVDRKKIGRKTFRLKEKYVIHKREEERKDSKKLSEDDLFADAGDPKLWDEKWRKKYPRKRGRLRAVCNYVANIMFYMLAVLQLWWKVGTLMPAPYHCLQNAFRSFYAGNCLEVLSVTSRGFSTIVTTAESKSLMSLFLATRKLKKCALNFGLRQSNEQLQSFSKESDKVFVLVSKRGLGYAAAYVQSLMYSGLNVSLIDVYDKMAEEKIHSVIRKGYSYVLKRHYITEDEVKEQFDRLSYHRGSDLSGLLSSVQEGSKIIVVDASISSDGGIGRQEGVAPKKIVEEIKKCSEDVVRVNVMCGEPSETMTAVLMNVGDPRRKNTLCVEITPPTKNFPTKDLRAVSSFVAATGKIPVITPPSPFCPTSRYLTLSFWNLAISLLNHFRGALSERKIDAILCKVGFTKGPFATMKELDRDYLLQLVVSGHFNDLSHYLTTGKNSYRDGRCRPPSDSDLAQLFMLHLGLRAMLAKKQCPSMSESAIDVLCVSGLIHFPPTEGGPLNYIIRLGQIETVKHFEDILFRIPNGQALFGNKDIIGISGVTEDTVCGSLFNAHQKSTVQSTEDIVVNFLELRNETVLLSNRELREIGVTHGLQNQEMHLTLRISLCLVVFVFCVMVAIIGMLAVVGYSVIVV